MSNTFGTIFRITTWGESHGKALGVVIDGCPAGLELSEQDIQEELSARRPGHRVHTSSRKETDAPHIFSGVFEGKTTGAPLSIVIFNEDAHSGAYLPTKDLFKPGHAQFTYLEKYGIFDYRGSGRASGRETLCRVAAGAVAKKILKFYEIELIAYLKEVAEVSIAELSFSELKKRTKESLLFCPDPSAELEIMSLLSLVEKEGDSVGGVVEVQVSSLPSGLGEPIYTKLEALLASAFLSIPGTKGFEIGEGFKASRMRGSSHNDSFTLNSEGMVVTKTNHAGGTLGGISTGMPLVARTIFKPTSSIQKSQETLSLTKEATEFNLPEGSRHDPCIAIRAVPVVEAMTALVLVDTLLMRRCNQL